MSSLIFALVDCNNFYVSCERVFLPWLEGKPVVVLSNNDGCIISRSNEAKAIGIAMGEPVHQCRNRLEQHGAKIFSANFTLYGDMSHRVMTVLEQFAPDVEVYSIDEAFLDLTGFKNQDLIAYGRLIRDTVKQWTGISVSIGIGPTKTLAKVAAEWAKKSTKAKGVVSLLNPNWQRVALERLPVADVWGVGRQSQKKLEAHGIRTALDLYHAEDKWIMKHFSVTMLRTVWELRGKACILLETEPPAEKGIMCSRSFGRQVTELVDLRQAVASYTARAAEKMRNRRLAAHGLMVFIKTNRFRPWEPQYHSASTIVLPVPTDCTHELIQYALAGLAQIYQSGYGYHKAGVMLLELISSRETQLNLLDHQDRGKLARLMAVMDDINRYHGRGMIQYAAEGLGKPWRMRQAYKSKRYTTRWDELMEVKAEGGYGIKKGGVIKTPL